MQNETDRNIPTLIALITNANTGLPYEGFGYVHSNYNKMDQDEKRILVEYENNCALNFNSWYWVLACLGLKPSLSLEDESKIRTGTFGFGGESEEHKKLKKYIVNHPESIDIKTAQKGTCKYIFLSGDRLDVFFLEANVVVEVKPKSAPDADILRGLFQCVKYKAILDAGAAVKGDIPDGEVVVVIGGTLSGSNCAVLECLGVDVVEQFECITK